VYKDARNIMYIALMMILSLFLLCCGSSTSVIPDCGTDISVKRILEEPPIPDEPERVSVELRFDNKAIVVTIAGTDRKTTYFYSQDGGNTWFHDALYQKLRAWQTHVLRDGEVLPWSPNPADPAVRYRTIHFPEQKSYNERSTDGGKNWTRMKGLIEGCTAEIDKGGAYFYHPRDRLTLYLNSFLPCLNSEVMFVSVDGGDSFRPMYEAAGSPALAISQSNPQVMYGAGTAGSLLKSTDGGKLWDLVGQNDLIRKTYVRRAAAGSEAPGKLFDEWPTDIDDIAIDPVDVNRVYLATSKGILCTENGGDTWFILNTGIEKARAIHSVVIAPGQPDILLVGTYKGLMRSTDRGCHWEWIDVMSRVHK
jgi:hypothetical protein